MKSFITTASQYVNQYGVYVLGGLSVVVLILLALHNDRLQADLKAATERAKAAEARLDRMTGRATDASQDALEARKQAAKALELIERSKFWEKASSAQAEVYLLKLWAAEKALAELQWQAAEVVRPGIREKVTETVSRKDTPLQELLRHPREVTVGGRTFLATGGAFGHPLVEVAPAPKTGPGGMKGQ